MSRRALLSAAGISATGEASPAQSAATQLQAELFAIGDLALGEGGNPGPEAAANLGALLEGMAKRLEVVIELTDTSQDKPFRHPRK